jgi:hypothetical protein
VGGEQNEEDEKDGDKRRQNGGVFVSRPKVK